MNFHSFNRCAKRLSASNDRLGGQCRGAELAKGLCAFPDASGKRRAPLGRPATPLHRRVAVYLGHVAFGLNYSDLARMFACDRTTVRRFCHQVEDMRDDPAIDVAIGALECALDAWTRRFDPVLISGEPS